MTEQQVVPQSAEAEQSVLGALLLDNDSFDRVHWLADADFYRDDHRVIFSTIRQIVEAGKPCDPLLLSEALKAKGDLERCGGHAYLGALTLNTPSAANIKAYANLVRRSAQLRNLQALARDLSEAVQSSGHDPIQVAELAADRAMAILDTPSRSEMRHVSEAVAEAVDRLDDPVHGISTGFPNALDDIVRLRPGDLFIIAGRPSMGKSGLALNIAEHVAAEAPVAVFSLEMTNEEIGTRMVRWHEHLSGRADAVKHLYTKKLWIDDSSSLTVGSMRVRLQRLKRKHGIKLAIVDYVQLMQGDGQNRTQEIGSISRGLKRLAKELQITVIAVSQLNRSVEQRTDKRPLMSDLRESGEIEQDADVIVMLYRDEYYNEDSVAKGTAEVLIRKQRNGATGKRHLVFHEGFARFRDYSGPAPREPEAKPRTQGYDGVRNPAGND